MEEPACTYESAIQEVLIYDGDPSASLPSIEFSQKTWINAIKYPQEMDEQGSPGADLDFVHEIDDKQRELIESKGS